MIVPFLERVTMDIILYKTNEPSNKLNKTLMYPLLINGAFNDSYDVINAELKISDNENDITEYNYTCIGEKYYFVNNWIKYRTGFYIGSLTLDVLMTYKTEILQQSGYNTYGANPNAYYSNYLSGYDVRKQVHRIEFEDNFNHNGTIVMLGIRGT